MTLARKVTAKTLQKKGLSHEVQRQTMVLLIYFPIKMAAGWNYTASIVFFFLFVYLFVVFLCV